MTAPEKCPGCGEPVKADWTVCEKCLLPRNLVSGHAEATVSIRCRCGSRIGPLDSVCPSCRRPKPRIEIVRSDTEQPTQPKAGGFSAIAGSLVFGLAALVMGYFIFSKQKTAQTQAPERTAPMAVSTATPTPNGEPGGTLPTPPENWTIKGRIYDLMTLRPISGAQLILKDKLSGKTFSVKTDAAGAYTLKLKPVDEGGYAVAVLLQGRAWPFLEEMDPPYQEQARDRRESALELLADSSLVHVPIMLPSGQHELAYDLVLTSSGRN
ncbi:MAG: carboxypeptidase regulatory-like domain-containing protein [Elusimicrobia bacterium]|nr:carboxypeptidase regulatory-like domain-containing protein [Elusimicrobiota bacterium]